MGCDLYEEKIMEYLDGALDGREWAKLEKHLLTCARCSKFLDDMQNQYAMLSDLPLLSPGQDFTQKVMKKIFREKIEGKNMLMIAIPASLMVILVASFLFATCDPAFIIPVLGGTVDWLVLIAKSVVGILNSALWTAGFTLKVITDLQPVLAFPAMVLTEIWMKYPTGAFLAMMMLAMEFSLWVRLLAPRKSYR
ncbi:MAG TPA: hypothetical protein GXX35_12615 [Thermoanaerobacterales bacterium]|nr:hypothetical protein [Thermoanaerobacterales bacterium]